MPVTPVLSPAELIASEPMHKRGTFATTTVDGHEGVIPAGYFEFDDERVGFRRDAPAPGADTDDVRTALRAGASPFTGPRFAAPARATAGDAPLTGVRVLEFTQLMAGPETGKLLRLGVACVRKLRKLIVDEGSPIVFPGMALARETPFHTSRDEVA